MSTGELVRTSVATAVDATTTAMRPAAMSARARDRRGSGPLAGGSIAAVGTGTAVVSLSGEVGGRRTARVGGRSLGIGHRVCASCGA